MVKPIKYWLICAMGFSSLSTLAQSDEINVSINELNGIYAGSYRFSINSEKQLEIAFYNGTGHYRNDVVYMDFLDPEKIMYNAEEQAVSIRCTASEAKCVDKEIFKLDIVRHSSRINLKEKNAVQAEKAIVLLKKIISLYIENEIEQEAKLGETRRKR